MKLLHIDSSIQADASASRRLSAAIVARLKDLYPALEVTRRDLAADPLPHLTLERFATEEAQATDPRNRDYDPAKVDAAVAGNPPVGTELLYDRDASRNEPLVISRRVVITGERLTNAAPSVDQQTGRPIVSVELDGQGARVMRDLTRESVGRRMAALLVDSLPVGTEWAYELKLDGYRALAPLIGPPAAAAMATTLPHQVLTNTPIIPDPRPIAPPHHRRHRRTRKNTLRLAPRTRQRRRSLLERTRKTPRRPRQCRRPYRPHLHPRQR